MPAPYEIEIDANAFLRSMSFNDKGTRRYGAPWEHAPHDAVHGFDSEGCSGEFRTRPTCIANTASTDDAPMSARARAVDKLKNEFYPAVAAGIPSAPNVWPEDPKDLGKLRAERTQRM